MRKVIKKTLDVSIYISSNLPFDKVSDSKLQRSLQLQSCAFQFWSRYVCCCPRKGPHLCCYHLFEVAFSKSVKNLQAKQLFLKGNETQLKWLWKKLRPKTRKRNDRKRGFLSFFSTNAVGFWCQSKSREIEGEFAQKITTLTFNRLLIDAKFLFWLSIYAKLSFSCSNGAKDLSVI